MIEGKSVRRHHILADPVNGVDVRCPDCGALMFKATDTIDGVVCQACRRCKDYDGNTKIWVFVFHSDPSTYVSSVKVESGRGDLLRYSD